MIRLFKYGIILEADMIRVLLGFIFGYLRGIILFFMLYFIFGYILTDGWNCAGC